MLRMIPMSEPSKAAFFDPSLLMISELNSDLIEEIKALQADRQKHAEAIAAIDTVLSRIGQTLTTIRNGGETGELLCGHGRGEHGGLHGESVYPIPRHA